VTARRRAGDAGSALRRGFTAVPPSPTPADDPPAPEAVPAAARPTKGSKGSKYTAILDDETATAFDELALKARRVLGRRVEKSELIRVLIMLAVDDASLREQLIAEVATRRGTR
jgi:hypothetical protein